MKLRKLNDVELSRILSMHADGKLHHATFGLPDDPDHGRLAGSGCAAGVAMNLSNDDLTQPVRALTLSMKVIPSAWHGRNDYAETPEELLQYLFDRGVA